MSYCDWRDVSGLINDRKSSARPFDTIKDIQRPLDLAQSLLKHQKCANLELVGPNPYDTAENQRVKPSFESVMRAVWRSAQRILHRARRRVKTPRALYHPPPLRNRRKTKIRTYGSTLEIPHKTVYSTPVAWRQGKELKNCI